MLSRLLSSTVLFALPLVMANGGCLVDVDIGNATFRCSAEKPDCPPGSICRDTVCQPIGDADGGSGDSSVDATPTACGDSFCTETCDSCSDDCGSCVGGMRLYVSGDDDGAEAPIDASGSGYVLTQTNVSRVDSPNGRAFSFDGTDGVVRLANADDFQTQTFAVAAFVRSTAMTMVGEEVVSMGDNWGVRIVPDGNVRLFAYNGMSYDSVQTVGVNVLDDAWHHIVAERDGGELRVYIDGVLSEASPMALGVVYNFGNDLTIGQHGTGQVEFRYTGEIDEVRVFDRGLSDMEVAGFAGL